MATGAAAGDNGRAGGNGQVQQTYVCYGGFMEVVQTADSLYEERDESTVLIGFHWKRRFFTPDQLVEFIWEERAAGRRVTIKVDDLKVRRRLENRFQWKARRDGLLELTDYELLVQRARAAPALSSA